MAVIAGELHTVPAAPPYRVALAQVPLAGSVAVVGFAGATTFAPPAGYFRVHTAPPQVEFHASAAGQDVLVSYEGTGSYVLSDDFSSGALSGTAGEKWLSAELAFPGAYAPAAITGGRLLLYPAAEASEVYSDYKLPTPGTYACVEVIDLDGIGADGDSLFEFHVVRDGGGVPGALMYVEGGLLKWSATVGADPSVTYDAAAHRWWKIEVDADAVTVRFYASPDGANWTLLGTEARTADSFAGAGYYPFFAAYPATGQVGSRTVTLDNYNNPDAGPDSEEVTAAARWGKMRVLLVSGTAGGLEIIGDHIADAATPANRIARLTPNGDLLTGIGGEEPSLKTWDFSTYADGPPAGFTGLQVGTPDILNGELRFTGFTLFDQYGAALATSTAGATHARVLVKCRMSEVPGPGTVANFPGVALTMVRNDSMARGFTGTMLETSWNGTDKNLEAQINSYDSLGNAHSAVHLLIPAAPITPSVTFWIEAETYQGALDRRVRGRAWMDGSAVPAWAFDFGLPAWAAALTGASGIGNQASSRVRYLAMEADGNWPTFVPPIKEGAGRLRLQQYGVIECQTFTPGVVLS